MSKLRKCCETPKGSGQHAPGCHQPAKAVTFAVEAGPKGKPVEIDETPNWSGKCLVCGSSPILDVTGMCGPCTFGEAATAGGNW